MKAQLLRNLLQALWLPVIWVSLLIIEITLLDGGRAQSFIARIFEDIVFFTSFLFYQGDFGLTSTATPFWRLMIAFSLQFFFWWSFAFLILTYVKRRRSQS
ncbi:MAG: hypothetical protein SGI74_00020 [Oligoflexia bacterium]|nr:hypothetical protein [Oligoflexia bacterium]